MSIYWFKPALMRQGAGDCGRSVTMRQHLTTGATATLTGSVLCRPFGICCSCQDYCLSWNTSHLSVGKIYFFTFCDKMHVTSKSL